MTDISIADLLLLKYPNQEGITIKGNNIVEWPKRLGKKPTMKDLKYLMPAAIRQNDILKIRELRLKEYPDVGEQLDIKYWDEINGTTVWKDLIKSIKDKYPKPRELETKNIEEKDD